MQILVVIPFITYGTYITPATVAFAIFDDDVHVTVDIKQNMAAKMKTTTTTTE